LSGKDGALQRIALSERSRHLYKCDFRAFWRTRNVFSLRLFKFAGGGLVIDAARMEGTSR